MPSHVRELARVARKVVKEETTFHTKQGAPLNELSGYKRFLLVLAKKNPNTAKSSRKKAAWTLVSL